MQEPTSTARATGSVSIPEPQRLALVARIQRDGETAVLAVLKVSPSTLARLAGGLPVRRATATVATTFLQEEANASR